MSSDRKVIIAIALSALVGLVVGAAGIALLSKSASRYYIEEVRHRLALDQELKGQEALRNGDAAMAVHHYRNLVFFTAGDSASVIEQAKQDWSLFFPLTGSVANYLYVHADPRALKAREGTSRAKLAKALESTGQKQEANEQYDRITALMGFNSNEKARVFAQELVTDKKKSN